VVTLPAPYTDGFTSVVDFDRDGDLDAIVQGKKAGQNTIYVWDIQTPTVLREFQLFTNWQEGASRANVADLDGDGQLEVSFVEFPVFYALDNDFSVLWTRNSSIIRRLSSNSIAKTIELASPFPRSSANVRYCPLSVTSRIVIQSGNSPNSFATSSVTIKSENSACKILNWSIL
jgi:hypothetical protein